jgi:Ran GTPase-activating protein (RanGAP) involved in mRNA processing and transport
MQTLPDALVARLFSDLPLQLTLRVSWTIRKIMLCSVSRLSVRVPSANTLDEARAFLQLFAGPVEGLSFAFTGPGNRAPEVPLILSLPWSESIVKLDLSGICFVTRDLRGFRQCLSALPLLHDLRLQGCRLASRGSVQMQQALCTHRSVRLLDLSRNGILNTGMEALALLLQQCPVRVLDVSENRFSYDAVDTLKEGLVKGSTVQTLLLSNNKFGKRSGLLLAEDILPAMPLTMLLLDGNMLCDEALSALLSALPVTIRVLSLAENRGTFALGDFLSLFLRKPGSDLEVLCCAWNRLEDMGTHRLAEGLSRGESRSLVELDVRSNFITDIGLTLLMDALVEFNALRVLRLGGNKTRGSFWEGALACQRQWQRLTVLDLGWMDMRCAGATELAPALATCTALQTLDLSGNCIGPQGIKALADAFFALTALEHLALRGNNLGPTGGSELASGLEPCRRLQTLSVPWCMLADAGVVSLSVLLPVCRSLREIDLSWNQVREAGAHSLRLGLACCRPPPRVALEGNEHMGGEGRRLCIEFPDRICMRREHAC